MSRSYEQVTPDLTKITEHDTGVILWCAGKNGESIISYSRQHVERWLALMAETSS